MKKAFFKILKVLIIALLALLLLIGVYYIIKLIGVKGEPSDETWDASQPFDPESAGKVVKKDGEDFTILLFSDIQIGANPFRDTKALKLMDKMVEWTKPDLILTTGDNTYFGFSGAMVPIIVEKMEGYGIPWGVVLGNHDSEGIADRNWVGNKYEGAENSLFKMGPDNVDGVGNYVVDVVDEAGQPVYALIMMDSNVERKYDSGRDYDYIHQNQIDWYQWAAEGQKDVPSMLFFHIPLPEFADLKELYEAGELESETTFGSDREPVCCPPENSGMFQKVLELGNTTNIIVGHDHINDLSALYQGVRLTYGLKTGPACYSDPDMQGATIITIEDGTNAVKVEHAEFDEGGGLYRWSSMK